MIQFLATICIALKRIIFNKEVNKDWIGMSPPSP